MLTGLTRILACLPFGSWQRSRETDAHAEEQSLPRYWSVPRVLPFVSFEGDGSGDVDLACLLEGWQSPLRVRPDNPRYPELRELLSGMRYGQSMRVQIDGDSSELVWAERTSDPPEVPVMEIVAFGVADERGEDT